ncbi:patr class I histocompatibility antigen, B-2 alpha chain-like [Megalobrama amblycephala]|uniref:patr class I histocompatibility antigen, B-2 alpha chain-like n=1 Tax=Megalobrama amblycephala TaxID=75352 RepID=UPI002013CC3A|nr:patr class I histocompatibility antigen, B-2 alpha chain-like [Megalobrama amblycephala]
MVHTPSFKNIFFIDVVMVWLIFHYCCLITDAHQEKHFLHYKFTALTKADTFPEFSAVVVADDRQIKHYNNEERVWILTENDDWTEPSDPPDDRDRFIHQIRTLTNCTNSQCSELHVLQRIIGCEVRKIPDGKMIETVFDEYGFDGEDFISLNYDTMQWIDKSPNAKITKMQWDRHTERNQALKQFFNNCVDWISTFMNTKKKKHFLHYKFTALTKADTFPEFSAEVVADDRRIKHFSDEERVWILTEDDQTEPPDPPDPRKWILHQIRTLTNCTNSQCSELHVLQRIIGCELEKLPDGTVNLTVFDEYGFDGEDFISFNSDTMKWIDKNPKAKETKEKWDHQTGRNQFIKYFFKNCIDWISKFNTKQSSPDVHIFARKAPDDDSNLVLTCLATGFYPRDVQMNIRLNRINLEDQTSSGIRPNDDETFQMRISVKINRNHEGSYDCLLIHSSLTEPVSVEWDGKCFKPEPRWSVIGGVAVLVLALVLILVAALITCCVYKWRNSDGLVRNHPSYGAVSDQIQMTSAASADVIQS